jgi:hypothetical protein
MTTMHYGEMVNDIIKSSIMMITMVVKIRHLKKKLLLLYRDYIVTMASKKENEEEIETFKKSNFIPVEELSWDSGDNDNKDETRNAYEEAVTEQRIIQYEEETIRMIMHCFTQEIEFSGAPLFEYITEKKIKDLLDLLEV